MLKNGSLCLSLVSHSDYTESFLIDGMIQPTILKMTNPAGEIIEPFDNRHIENFKTEPTRDQFENLMPKETRIVYSKKPEKLKSGRYLISWGKLQYLDLAPGQYKVYVDWESKHAKPLLPNEGEPLFENWRGKLKSNVVTFTLHNSQDKKSRSEH